MGTESNQLFGVVALADDNVWAVGSSIPKPDTGAACNSSRAPLAVLRSTKVIGDEV